MVNNSSNSRELRFENHVVKSNRRLRIKLNGLLISTLWFMQMMIMSQAKT